MRRKEKIIKLSIAIGLTAVLFAVVMCAPACAAETENNLTNVYNSTNTSALSDIESSESTTENTVQNSTVDNTTKNDAVIYYNDARKPYSKGRIFVLFENPDKLSIPNGAKIVDESQNKSQNASPEEEYLVSSDGTKMIIEDVSAEPPLTQLSTAIEITENYGSNLRGLVLFELNNDKDLVENLKLFSTLDGALAVEPQYILEKKDLQKPLKLDYYPQDRIIVNYKKVGALDSLGWEVIYGERFDDSVLESAGFSILKIPDGISLANAVTIINEMDEISSTSPSVEWVQMLQKGVNPLPYAEDFIVIKKISNDGKEYGEIVGLLDGMSYSETLKYYQSLDEVLYAEPAIYNAYIHDGDVTNIDFVTRSETVATVSPLNIIPVLLGVLVVTLLIRRK